MNPIEDDSPPPPLIDVNVSLSRWPMRRAPDDETEKLVKRLTLHGVIEAWAGSYDGIFHKDVASVNQRLAKDCAATEGLRLLPMGTVNLSLPQWEADLRRCVEDHAMPGIRLHPNYHGYGLEDPRFARLLEMAANRGLIVQLAVIMEDARMMHPLLRVPAVDVSPLPSLLKNFPELPLILLNALSTVRGQQLTEILSVGRVFVELANLEGVAGIERLLPTVSHERILFGSHAPSLYFESALWKLRESTLAEFQRAAIAHDNAHHLRSGANHARP